MLYSNYTSLIACSEHLGWAVFLLVREPLLLHLLNAVHVYLHFVALWLGLSFLGLLQRLVLLTHVWISSFRFLFFALSWQYYVILLTRRTQHILLSLLNFGQHIICLWMLLVIYGGNDLLIHLILFLDAFLIAFTFTFWFHLHLFLFHFNEFVEIGFHLVKLKVWFLFVDHHGTSSMVIQGLEFLDLPQQWFILFLVSGFDFFH